MLGPRHCASARCLAAKGRRFTYRLAETKKETAVEITHQSPSDNASIVISATRQLTG